MPRETSEKFEIDSNVSTSLEGKRVERDYRYWAKMTAKPWTQKTQSVQTPGASGKGHQLTAPAPDFEDHPYQNHDPNAAAILRKIKGTGFVVAVDLNRIGRIISPYREHNRRKPA